MVRRVISKKGPIYVAARTAKNQFPLIAHRSPKIVQKRGEFSELGWVGWVGWIVVIWGELRQLGSVGVSWGEQGTDKVTYWAVMSSWKLWQPSTNLKGVRKFSTWALFLETNKDRWIQQKTWRATCCVTVAVVVTAKYFYLPPNQFRSAPAPSMMRIMFIIIITRCWPAFGQQPMGGLMGGGNLGPRT